MVTFVSKFLAVDRFPIKFDLEENNFRCIVTDKILDILENLVEGDGLVVVGAPDCFVLHANT